MTQGDHLKSDEQKAAATSLAEDRSDEPVWGEHRGWSRRQTITAIGVAAVIAGLGGAAIYAASSSGVSAVPHGMPGPGGPGGPGGGGTTRRCTGSSSWPMTTADTPPS